MGVNLCVKLTFIQCSAMDLFYSDPDNYLFVNSRDLCFQSYKKYLF